MKRMSFDGESITAILAGRQTETTRVVKPQPKLHPDRWERHRWHWECPYNQYDVCDPHLVEALVRHSHYHVGDIVAVTEWWSPYANWSIGIECKDIDKAMGLPVKPCCYKADYLEGCDPLAVGGSERWCSPLSMPSGFSRITIEVTSVAAGRVQELTLAQILAEGYVSPVGTWQLLTASELREMLQAANDWWQRRWDAVNPQFTYESNPWVRRYGFKVLEAK